MKPNCLLALILLSSLISLAQNNLGLPDIINYSKFSYNGGTQNWGIAQDKNGIMYFANNEGLMSFDGTNWKIYPLPNQTIVRSVALDITNGRIYVGGQDEIGFFSPDKDGRLRYTSLVPVIPIEHRSFADVWSVLVVRGSVFFRSSNKIFQYNDHKFTTYPATEWLFLGLANDILLAQDVKKGLLQFHNGFWIPFSAGKELPQSLVTSFTAINKTTALITTLKNGCYILKQDQLKKWETPALNTIAANKIYTSKNIGSEKILLGTSIGGCYIIDEQGNLIAAFSRKEGLQNNNILCVFSDRDKNIWLGLENGIDFVGYNSAIKHIYPSQDKEVSGYSSIIHNDQLYLGTSNGLYRASLSGSRSLNYAPANFELVANSSGQVWNVSEVNGKILLGHHEGSFLVEGDKATPLDQSTGFWAFLPMYNVLPSALMVAGSYRGIGFYTYQNGRFQKAGEAPFESARFVFVDGNDIWVSHPYKGIYKVIKKDGANPFVKHYDLQSVNNNYIFKIRNRVVVTSESGVYEYNPSKDSFEVAKPFNDLFGNKIIRYLKEDKEGNIWFVFRKSLGVVDMSATKPSIIYVSEMDNKMVSGFEHVYPLDARNVFVGGEHGFYHINFEAYKKNISKADVGIRSVSAYNKRDSLLFGGYSEDARQARSLSYGWNTLHFEYSSTLFGHQQNIEYSYLLDGFDKTWSEWTKKTAKEYTNLPAGKYSFKVKARTNLGNESAPSVYTFTVLPPWYQAPWMYAIYFILASLALYLLYYHQKRKLEHQRSRHAEEQRRLHYLHKLELDQNERQIVQLKNEKLEAEINHKNKDLATVAMHLVQKGELLTKIKEELIKTQKRHENEKLQDSFKKLIRILNEEERNDEDWEHFSVHFDKVHSNFLLSLKEHYPNLSPNELKLSAYLRMNLSSKEIAQLLNISVRGVEIGRYRLRKKLGIPTEVSLFDFLMSFATSPRQVVLSE